MTNYFLVLLATKHYAALNSKNKNLLRHFFVSRVRRAAHTYSITMRAYSLSSGPFR